MKAISRRYTNFILVTFGFIGSIYYAIWICELGPGANSRPQHLTQFQNILGHAARHIVGVLS